MPLAHDSVRIFCERSLKTAAAFFLVFNVFMQNDSLSNDKTEKATFAGGCFWCMEEPFRELPGVADVITGYTGGHTKNPTYEEVCAGKTGHYEAVEVTYDPSKVSYETLLGVFWRQIDPADPGGQFADRGSQYRTAIFYHDDGQRKSAEKSKEELERSKRFNKPIVTQILKSGEFYGAEEHHQGYYKKCPVKYGLYKTGSGRASFTKEKWSDKTRKEPNTELTPLQHHVTRECGTEPPFKNEYWDNKKEGIYVDIVSGEPLFSSLDKFDSGTGWPSFVKPLEPVNIVEKEDDSLLMIRTEVRSRQGGCHLGHVFNDGPGSSGLRYCINSAALRFIPKEDLEREGYGEYKKLFEKGAIGPERSK